MNITNLIDIIKQKPNKKTIKIGLIAAILFQSSVLTIEYLGSVLPIWTGERIVLETNPVDPRSLFRGNFVRLNYVISRVEIKQKKREGFKKGSPVFLSLSENNGLWVPTNASMTKPKDGIFIRGRIENSRSNNLDIRYGIEAFFLPKDKSLDIERKARGKAHVYVYVGPNGKARAAGFKCIGVDC